VEKVRGGIIFPNRPLPGATPTVVDQFLATRVGTVANEPPVSKTVAAPHGVFTGCFLEAFKRPYPDMVVQTADGQKVIPNRRLKNFLGKEVPNRAQKIGIPWDQQPDCKIYSDEPVYIGHVLSLERETSAPSLTPTIADVAGLSLEKSGLTLGLSHAFSTEAIDAVAADSGFSSTQRTVAGALGFSKGFSAPCGFIITGQRVRSVTSTQQAKIINSAEGSPATSIVEMALSSRRSASVALRFADRFGTVVAALGGYIANIVVEGGRVTSVSYQPAQRNALSSYEQERLQRLHAAVSTAAQYGVFRIEGPKDARRTAAARLADTIRIVKSIDPTLGLYAAYAYSDAGLFDQARSVRGYMREDLDTDLFDVAMLTGALAGKPIDPRGVNPVPFCPMLSQGWALLRVKGIQFPEALADMQDHLRLSLWLTLDNEGLQIAESVLPTRSDA
jgi:hypothetical protein